MEINVPALGRAFEMPRRHLTPYIQAQMARALPRLRGHRLTVDFQKDIDGPQTAARLIRETLGEVRVVWVSFSLESEAFIWIQGGSGHLRFAFVVADPNGRRGHIMAECGPRELTATIITAICEYFRQSEQKQPVSGDEMDWILSRVGELNREITGASLAKDLHRAAALMGELADCVRQLSALGGRKAVKPIADALADSELAYEATGLPEARTLSLTAIDALKNVGQVAIPLLKQHVNDSRPPVSRAFSEALRECRGKRWWQVWK